MKISPINIKSIGMGEIIQIGNIKIKHRINRKNRENYIQIQPENVDVFKIITKVMDQGNEEYYT